MLNDTDRMIDEVTDIQYALLEKWGVDPSKCHLKKFDRDRTYALRLAVGHWLMKRRAIKLSDDISRKEYEKHHRIIQKEIKKLRLTRTYNSLLQLLISDY